MIKNTFMKTSILLAFILIYMSQFCFATTTDTDENTAESTTADTVEQTRTAMPAPLVSAQSFVLMDGDTGQTLYAYEENATHYPASITKLMTALLSIENLNPTDIMTFSKNAVMSIEYGSSHIGIQEGEKITVDQALHGLLLMSANEVANGLAEAVGGSIEGFGAMMTDRAHELGALNTNFVNPHGLHDENHYTTAYDMALIMKQLLTQDYFLKIMKDVTYEIGPTNLTTEIRYLSQQHKMMNQKRSDLLYREDVIAGKTGFTDQSGHTLVTAAREGNRTLIVVLMNADGNSMYADTSQLLDYGFSSFKALTFSGNDFSQLLPIVDRTTDLGDAVVAPKTSVTFYVPQDISLSDLVLTPDLPESLPLTQKIGDKAGTLTVAVDGTTLATLDLVVTELQSDDAIAPATDVAATPAPETDKSGSRLLYLLFFAFVIECNLLFHRHGLTLRKPRRRRKRAAAEASRQRRRRRM